MLYASIMVYHAAQNNADSATQYVQKYTFILSTNCKGTVAVDDHGCGLEVVTFQDFRLILTCATIMSSSECNFGEYFAV